MTPCPRTLAPHLLLLLVGSLAAAPPGPRPRPGAPVVLLDLGDTVVRRDRRWIPGARVALLLLRRAGYRLGVLSNTGDLTRQELVRRRLPPGFDFGRFDPELVLLSSEVGMEKPAPELFALARRRSGEGAQLVVVVDEDPSLVAAAEVAGLEALRVSLVRDRAGRVVGNDLGAVARRLVERLRAGRSGCRPAGPG